MSKTASLGYAPSTSLFSRLVALVDNFLASTAKIALRNNDLPPFGL
jgi:hypothetical protein